MPHPRGIRYLIDERGDRTAVVIDLRAHRELWEDFYDNLLVESRLTEPRESLEDVRMRLRRRGKLRRNG